MIVGAPGFEPATPSSRTRSEAGRPLKIRQFSSSSRTFVRFRFARSCGRTCGRERIVQIAVSPDQRRLRRTPAAVHKSSKFSEARERSRSKTLTFEDTPRESAASTFSLRHGGPLRCAPPTAPRSGPPPSPSRRASATARLQFRLDKSWRQRHVTREVVQDCTPAFRLDPSDATNTKSTSSGQDS